MERLLNITGGSIQSKLTMWDVVSHVTLWILVSIVTFGAGLLFWPFAAAQMCIDSVEIEDGDSIKAGKLRCNINVMAQASVVGLWLLIILLGGTWLYILCVIVASAFAIPFGIYSGLDHQVAWIASTAFMLIVAYPFYVWSAVRASINHTTIV